MYAYYCESGCGARAAKMRLNTLAELVDITPQNLSVLKTGKAKAIRFDTLEKICEVLDCQPGDILAFSKEVEATA